MTIEVEKTTEKKELDMFDSLITEAIDFRVEKRGIHTYGEDGGLHMPNHSATIRINPDGSEQDLWVVGSRYEVVDHREVIKQFANILDKASMSAEVSHTVYGNGCRIFSTFVLEKQFDLDVGEGKTKKIRPFFSLTTSHDGNLKVGFLLGAKVGKRYMVLSKKLYGAWAKHTKGINIERTLKDIDTALRLFIENVIPVWTRMHKITLKGSEVNNIIEKAISDGVITKLRAKDLNTSSGQSLWQTFLQVVDSVNEVRGKKGNPERAFWRNTKANEYFRKVVERVETERHAAEEVEEVEAEIVEKE